jgi:leucyl aminopeptidase
MQFKINPKSPSTSALRIIPVLGDQAETILGELLGSAVPSKSLFSGKKDSSYSFEHANQLVLLIGLGGNPEYKTIENSFRRVLSKNSSLVEKEVHLDFPAAFSQEQIEAALVGFQLGAYSVGFYKKEKSKDYSKLKVR